jgi:hypothetical protein
MPAPPRAVELSSFSGGLTQAFLGIERREARRVNRHERREVRRVNRRERWQ